MVEKRDVTSMTIQKKTISVIVHKVPRKRLLSIKVLIHAGPMSVSNKKLLQKIFDGFNSFEKNLHRVKSVIMSAEMVAGACPRCWQQLTRLWTSTSPHNSSPCRCGVGQEHCLSGSVSDASNHVEVGFPHARHLSAFEQSAATGTLNSL